MASGDDVVVHLVVSRLPAGSYDPKFFAPYVVGGLAVVGVGVLRVLFGGQDAVAFVSAVLLAAVIVGFVVLYGYLRFWNATVYLHRDHVGTTNAFGLRRAVHVRDVDYLLLTQEPKKGMARLIGVLQIVTKNRNNTIRFSGGERLEPGGIERLAAAIGVPIQGSW